MPPSITWRLATEADLDTILAIQAVVHAAFAPERRETFERKMALFPQGCRMLMARAEPIGYGVSHPWRLDDAPALDTVLPGLPEPADCLFIHDVALLPPARGHGAGKTYVEAMREEARRAALDKLALISVYGTVPIWERCGFALRPSHAIEPKLVTYGETARYMVAPVVPADA